MALLMKHPTYLERYHYTLAKKIVKDTPIIM